MSDKEQLIELQSNLEKKDEIVKELEAQVKELRDTQVLISG